MKKSETFILQVNAQLGLDTGQNHGQEKSSHGQNYGQEKSSHIYSAAENSSKHYYYIFELAYDDVMIIKMRTGHWKLEFGNMWVWKESLTFNLLVYTDSAAYISGFCQVSWI